jgi:hypothetical protein
VNRIGQRTIFAMLLIAAVVAIWLGGRQMSCSSGVACFESASGQKKTAPAHGYARAVYCCRNTGWFDPTYSRRPRFWHASVLCGAKEIWKAG